MQADGVGKRGKKNMRERKSLERYLWDKGQHAGEPQEHAQGDGEVV
jgi:hypothetical protein